jgi:hypothetical protein
VGLLVVALILGVLLLNATDGQPPGTTVSSGGPAPTAGAPAARAGTTTTSTTSTMPVHAAKDVKVVVANASDAKGAGQRVSDTLKTAGYNTLAPTNAAVSKDSFVYFTPGYEREAAAIAQALAFPPTTVKPLPTPAPVADLRTANILVILGSDQAPRFATAAATTTTAHAAAATTTTTAKKAAATTTSTTAKK